MLACEEGVVRTSLGDGGWPGLTDHAEELDRNDAQVRPVAAVL